jgi:hypothetical protein
MKKLILLALFLSTSVTAFGEVTTRVCEADGNTPFDGRDIIVGTKLTIYINSNVAEEGFWGGLAMEDANMANIGLIYGRDCDEYECPNSCLPPAGDGATVWISCMYPGPGFELNGGFEPFAGDWFVFDYNSIDLGDCNVAFYNYDVNEFDPVIILRFHHIRTPDFNRDTIVNLVDFTELASFWWEANCGDMNDCNETDLNDDGKIDYADLKSFTDYWLKKPP